MSTFYDNRRRSRMKVTIGRSHTRPRQSIPSERSPGGSLLYEEDRGGGRKPRGRMKRVSSSCSGRTGGRVEFSFPSSAGRLADPPDGIPPSSRCSPANRVLGTPHSWAAGIRRRIIRGAVQPRDGLTSSHPVGSRKDAFRKAMVRYLGEGNRRGLSATTLNAYGGGPAPARRLRGLATR